MKTERIPKPVLAFALILALNAMSVSAETPLDISGSKADMWFDCWNCPYQCHGDADCRAQGGIIKYRVYINDLEIIYAVYMGYGHWPARYPEDLNYNPCADFDHDLDVDNQDLAILESGHMRTDVPPDCPRRPIKLEPIDPNTLPSGSTYTIKWTDVPTGSCEAPYYLKYSTDNGENWLPVDENSVSGACSYDWVVPQVDSNQCLLSIHDGGYPWCDWEPMCWISLRDTTDEPFAIYECQEAFAGDLDRSCYLDFRDYAILVLNWSLGPDFRLILQLADQWCDCGNPYDPACGY